MSDEPKKRLWRWPYWTAIFIFALYPLSIGPVAWFVIRSEHESVNSAYLAVYQPLFWAAELSQPTSDALSRYLDFWIVVEGSDD